MVLSTNCYCRPSCPGCGTSLCTAAVLSIGIEVLPASGANVYSLLRRDYVIMTKPALDSLVARLQRPINRLGLAGLAFREKLEQRRAAAARQQRIERNWVALKMQKQATG
jgi:hypothetical protein